MNCKFCEKPIEQNNENKWVTVETGKLHYWECDAPNAPRLKGKKKFTPKEPTVDATPHVIDILGGFGKQLTRLEEKIDALIAQTAYKKATGEELVQHSEKVAKMFEKPDPNATMKNPEDVQK